jgi:asparagine synthase (glutamine-hydrolysing)
MGAMPLEHKLDRPGYGKRLLRDAARALGLPEQAWQAADKLGFASPVPQWLGDELAAWCQQKIGAATALTRPGELRALLQAGLEPGGPFDRCRLQALMTAAWCAASLETAA